jgi:hypothetical protein
MKGSFVALAALAASSPGVAQDLSTVAPMAGTWRYAATAGGSEATFSNNIGAPQLTLRCTRATRQVTISKTASAPASSLRVWSSSQSRNLPAVFTPATARVSADVAFLDPLLDSLALSRGRIGFSTPGTAALVLPAWPELARVVEDCRT